MNERNDTPTKFYCGLKLPGLFTTLRLNLSQSLLLLYILKMIIYFVLVICNCRKLWEYFRCKSPDILLKLCIL